MTVIEQFAECFIKKHWAGGIGIPNGFESMNLYDALEAVWAASHEGPTWQKRAILDLEDDCFFWESGSGLGQIRITKDSFELVDKGTSEDLAYWYQIYKEISK